MTQKLPFKKKKINFLNNKTKSEKLKSYRNYIIRLAAANQDNLFQLLQFQSLWLRRQRNRKDHEKGRQLASSITTYYLIRRQNNNNNDNKSNLLIHLPYTPCIC